MHSTFGYTCANPHDAHPKHTGHGCKHYLNSISIKVQYHLRIADTIAHTAIITMQHIHIWWCCRAQCKLYEYDCVHYMQLGVQYMYRAFTNNWKTVIPITVSKCKFIDSSVHCYVFTTCMYVNKYISIEKVIWSRKEEKARKLGTFLVQRGLIGCYNEIVLQFAERHSLS